jgi:3-methyladenine DNA glycosylase AlkD
MKYYIQNPKIDSQITEIRLKIRLSMNGIVSEQMSANGIIYKKNYGVSIPRLKEIAKAYHPNHDLAQRLWDLQIRETMILATLLETVDEISKKNAQNWVDDFNNIEIVEQTCMNLFCKIPEANLLSLKWIESTKSWEKITGFILAARISDKLSANEIQFVFEMSIAASEKDNFHLYKAVSLCLSRFCRKDKSTASYILKEIGAFEQSSLIGQQFILNEVKQEILFLDII